MAKEMSPKDMVDHVKETFKAVEAGHAKDRSEATYVIFWRTAEDVEYVLADTEVTVPSRTQRKTVHRKAREALTAGTSLTDVVLIVVPKEYAEQKRWTRKTPEPEWVIGDA